MLILRLVDLHTKELTQVAWAESLPDMVKFLEQEKSIVPYVDGMVTKVFRMGSILENYAGIDHPLYKQYEVPAIDDVGNLDDWVKGTIRNYRQTQELLHEVKGGE